MIENNKKISVPRFYVIYDFVNVENAWYKNVNLFMDDLSKFSYDKLHYDACFAGFNNYYKNNKPMYLLLNVIPHANEVVDKLSKVLTNYSITVERTLSLKSVKINDGWYNIRDDYKVDDSNEATNEMALFKIDCNKFTKTESRWYSLLCVGLALRLLSVNETPSIATLNTVYDAYKDNVLKLFRYLNAAYNNGGHTLFNESDRIPRILRELNNIELIDSFDYDEYNNSFSKNEPYYPPRKLEMKYSNNFRFINEVILNRLGKED